MIRAKSLFSTISMVVVTAACSGGHNNENRPPQQQTPPQMRFGAPQQRPPGYGVNGANTAIDPTLQRPSQDSIPSRTARADSDSSTASNTGFNGNSGSTGNLNGSGNLASTVSSGYSPSPLTDAKIDQIVTSVPLGSPDYAPNRDVYVNNTDPSVSRPSTAAPAPTTPVAVDPAPVAVDPAPVAVDPAVPVDPNGNQGNGEPATPPPGTQVGSNPPDQPAPPPDQSGSGLQQLDRVSTILTDTQSITDPNWMPGLPRAPFPVSIPTYGNRPTDGVFFSDGKADSIMAYFLDQMGRDPNLAKANSDLGASIQDVHLTVDKNDQATVYISLLEDPNAPAAKQIGFTGRRTGARIFEMTRVDQTQTQFNYKATLMCEDQNQKTCENAAVALQRLDSNSIMVARAFMVQRLGSAIVTMGRTNDAKNPNRKKFQSFVMHSRYHVCMTEKAGALNADIKKKLNAKCSGKSVPKDGAAQILMRTWSVAHGASRFEVIFDEGSGQNDPWFQTALVLTGQLVLFADPTTGKPTIHSEPVKVDDRSPVQNHVSRESWFVKDGVELMNNDGAGAINLKLHFDGSPDESMRISVTSNLRKTVPPKTADAPAPTATPAPTPSASATQDAPATTVVANPQQPTPADSPSPAPAPQTTPTEAPAPAPSDVPGI